MRKKIERERGDKREGKECISISHDGFGLLVVMMMASFFERGLVEIRALPLLISFSLLLSFFLSTEHA